jgi:prophage DNA circulation protein
MSWESNLQIASFKGATFDVEAIEDLHARAVALHEYPYRDGADVEDLAQHARRWRFKVILWGDDYEGAFGALMDALDEGGAGALMHPVLGGIAKAVATSWNFEHSVELWSGVRGTIDFVEDTTRDPVFTSSSPVSAADAVEAQADAADAAADTALVATAQTVAAAGDQSRLDAFVNNLSNSVGSFLVWLSDTSLQVTLSGQSYGQYPTAFTSDVSAVLQTAINGLAFGGRNMAFAVPNVTPAAGDGLADYALTVRRMNAAASAVPTGTPDAVAINAHANVRAATMIARAASIVLAAEVETPLLSRDDVEQVASQARTAVQAAIVAARAAFGVEQANAIGVALRATGSAVQEAALAVVTLRPPLVTQPAPVTGPLRLVAFALYGDATRAQEIARLSRYGRDLFIAKGQPLYVYAQ